MSADPPPMDRVDMAAVDSCAEWSSSHPSCDGCTPRLEMVAIISRWSSLDSPDPAAGIGVMEPLV